MLQFTRFLHFIVELVRRIAGSLFSALLNSAVTSSSVGTALFFFGFLIQNFILYQGLQNLQSRLCQLKRGKICFLSLSLLFDNAFNFFQFDGFAVDGRCSFVWINSVWLSY